MAKDTQTTQDAAEAPVAAAPVPLLQEAPTDASEDTEHRVRRWVAENLGHSRIARDVEAWNELQAALPALVKIIEA